jgi:hypothetical protein
MYRAPARGQRQRQKSDSIVPNQPSQQLSDHVEEFIRPKSARRDVGADRQLTPFHWVEG